MLEIISRDGLAREAVWTAPGGELRTPNILFIGSHRIRAFGRGEAFLSAAPVSESKFSVRPGASWFPVPPLSIPAVSDTARATAIPAFPNIPAGLEAVPGEAHAACLESFRASGSTLFPVAGVFPADLRTAGLLPSGTAPGKGPSRADATIGQQVAEVLVLASAVEDSLRPRKLAEELARLKEASGYTRLVYTPGLGEVSHLALLCYCGVDLFDSSPLLAAARKGIRLLAGWRMEGSERGACHCPACEKGETDVHSLYEHNCYAALSEVRTIRHAIRKGRLRELVESRLSEPWLVSLLRHMDLRQGALCERFSPVNRPETAGPILALAKASLDRPEVVRFRERVVHRYKRPPGAPVLLLLPCSARKPYSSSLSHRMFRSRIDRCRNPGAVHEVVVTSPLGVVPLELENFYPAGNYDVPVTGDWDAEEMRVLREELKAFVTAGKYHRVVCHLPGMEFLKAVLPEHTAFTVTGSATSHDSLDRLEEALRTAVHEVPKKGRREALFERLQALCRFQFGEGGPALLEGCDIKFRGPDIKFMGAGNFQAGMVLHDRGLVSLTMDGGKRLLGKTGYEVEIGDFMPSSAVFAAGVLHAGPVIRPGDEVLVVHKGELRGVGVAVMSACEMEERGKGTAVKVRHHISSGKEKGNEGKEATEE